MKTNLDRRINSIREAKAFLFELYKNGEGINPDDDAHEIVWGQPSIAPSYDELEQLNKLMGRVWAIARRSFFDPHEYILDKLMPYREPEGHRLIDFESITFESTL